VHSHFDKYLGHQEDRPLHDKAIAGLQGFKEAGMSLLCLEEISTKENTCGILKW